MQAELIKKVNELHYDAKIYTEFWISEKTRKSVMLSVSELLELINKGNVTKNYNQYNELVYFINGNVELSEKTLLKKREYKTENIEGFTKLGTSNYEYIYYKFNDDNTITFKLGSMQKTYKLTCSGEYVYKFFKTFIKVISKDDYKRFLEDDFYKDRNIGVIRKALEIY
jgi:hypothetical protein